MDDYRFSHRLKVRYSEIDGQKIVFNSHYLTYIDVAVTEYFQQLLQPDEEFDFVLAKSTIEYKRSAYLNDWLTIWCRVEKVGTKSMTMSFMITREDEEEPVLLAEIIYVSVDHDSLSPCQVPDIVRERIEQFELEYQSIPHSKK
ncbi:thioesterase family protein [Bacillus sp. OK048]|uniref:acyl-CoA thioesterase n=1 Tax=Bacillus sp. OK048 TaxID=1882761 RepID=UPI00088F2C74|nr:thioesterase family protein [Bacillus sp. OK048]SDN45303.1 acyl-CoA thioester hydrolase [Bacillus sp. OK048]